MSKHTPGPWIVDDRHIHPKSGLTYPHGQEPETDVILIVDTDCHASGLLNETDKANLALAASAPDLLQALKMAHYCLTNEEIVSAEDLAKTKLAMALAIEKAEPLTP